MKRQMTKDMMRHVPSRLRRFVSGFICIWMTLSCGTSGGIERSPNDKSSDVQKNSNDDQARREFLALFDTPELIECRDKGLFYDRRQEKCRSDLKLKDAICHREGIIQAFSGSGVKITQILDRSLGDPAKPGDKGDGYVVDQCGAGSSGRIFVSLLKQGAEGKLEIRELETK